MTTRITTDNITDGTIVQADLATGVGAVDWHTAAAVAEIDLKIGIFLRHSKIQFQQSSHHFHAHQFHSTKIQK